MTKQTQKAINYLLLHIFMLSMIGHYEVKAQCGCMSSISAGALSPTLGTSTTGTMRENFLSINLFNIYTYGNKYYQGSKLAPPDVVNEFSNITNTLYLSYGITKQLSLDFNFNYISQNSVDAPPFVYKSSGFGNIGILAKYNFYYNPRNDFEFTAGIGGNIPIKKATDTTYIYLQPSNGSFSGIGQIFLHKGFQKEKFNLYLINRSEFFGLNNVNYRFGNTITTSLMATYNLSENLIFIAELRNEYKNKDKNNDYVNPDSGYNNFILSPQITYLWDKFSISLKYDNNTFRNYNGLQASKNYSLYLNFGYNFKID